MTAYRHALVMLLMAPTLGTVGACGSGASPVYDVGGPADTSSDAGPEDIVIRDLSGFEPSAPPEDLLGTLRLTEWVDPLSGLSLAARIMGQFYTSPEMAMMTRIEDRGSCTLWALHSVPCDECADRPCLPDGSCWVHPTFLSVGDLQLEGLKTGPLSIDDNISHFYGYSDIAIKDLFDPGAPISVSASGGDVNAFALNSVGVGPMTLDDWPLVSDPDKIMHQITLPAGEDYTFTWAPRFSYDTIRLVLKASNMCHGCPLEAKIVCQGPDTGSFTVPKELLAQMPSVQALFGGCPHSDCPLSTLTRLREDFVQTQAGWLGLVVESTTAFGINHSGL